MTVRIPSREPAQPAAGGSTPVPDPASERAALRRRFRFRNDGAHRHLLAGSSVLVVGAAVQGLGGMVFSLIVVLGLA